MFKTTEIEDAIKDGLAVMPPLADHCHEEKHDRSSSQQRPITWRLDRKAGKEANNGQQDQRLPKLAALLDCDDLFLLWDCLHSRSPAMRAGRGDVRNLFLAVGAFDQRHSETSSLS